MWLYDIQAGPKHYTSRNNPNALMVELDVTTVSAAGNVTIWMAALKDSPT